MLCLCSKKYCCYDATSIDNNFSTKGLNKRARERGADGHLEHCRCVQVEKSNSRLINSIFRTHNQAVATEKGVMKRFSCFIPRDLLNLIHLTLNLAICEFFNCSFFLSYVWSFLQSKCILEPSIQSFYTAFLHKSVCSYHTLLQAT